MTLINVIAAAILVCIVLAGVLLRRSAKRRLDEADGLGGVVRAADLKESSVAECVLGESVETYDVEKDGDMKKRGGSSEV